MTPWNKGLTKETHPSIAKTGFQLGHNPYNYWLGKTHNEETKRKISEVQKGVPKNRVPKSVNYNAIHAYMRRKYGTPNLCQNIDCESKSNRFDRALIRGRTYSYNPNDYIGLCRRCHLDYDHGRVDADALLEGIKSII